MNISKTDIGISGGMNNMFQESVKKRSAGQIVGIICVFILALLIVFTFVLYGIFKDDNSAPSLFGNRIYIMNGNGMEPRIAQGSAVFIDEGVMPAEPGNVILCNIDGRLAVLGYIGSQSVTAADGTVTTRYIVKYDNTPADQVWAVEAEDIIGRAVSYDAFLGGVIRFASSKTGILAIVIIPCAALIIYEIVMLLMASKRSRKAEANARDNAPDPTLSFENIQPLTEPRRNRAAEKKPFRADNVDDSDPIMSFESMRDELSRQTDGRQSDPSLSENDMFDHIRTASHEDMSAKSSGFTSVPEYMRVQPSYEQNQSVRTAQESAPFGFTADAEPQSRTEPLAEAVKPLEGQQVANSQESAKAMSSRIDELIRLLEEEKSRLADK